MNELEISEYGKKPFWLKVKKLLRRRQKFVPLFISRGCFKGFKELLI